MRTTPIDRYHGGAIGARRVLTEREERRIANVKWILQVVYGIEEPDHDWPDQLTRMTAKLREAGLIEPREEHDERRQA